jgi:hypothetical protein
METTEKKPSTAKEQDAVNLKAQAAFKLLRDKERVKVKGIFRFHEVPGGVMEFAFRKFKGDPIEYFKLTDGKVEEIPLCVARHLNTNCFFPAYTYRTNEAGLPVMAISEKIRRCSFQSLEFNDIENVENAGVSKPA